MISGASEEELDIANARADIILALDNTATYESWLCIDTYIEQLQQENEETTRTYAKIRDEICDYLDSNRFCENFENVGNEENVRKNILEILLKWW